MEIALRHLFGDKAKVDLATVKGGIWDVDTDVVSPEANSFQYDESSALRQAAKQEVVGSQVLFHFDLKEDSKTWTTNARVEAIREAVENLLSIEDLKETIDCGSVKLLIGSDAEKEVVISVLDSSHVLVDLFVWDSQEAIASKFTAFMDSTSDLLELVRVDEQPRGYGRIVSFGGSSVGENESDDSEPEDGTEYDEL